MATKNESLYYRDNKNLRGPNVEIEYTPEQVEEVVRCAEDPAYFIRKYVKILSPKGMVDFDLYGYQERFIKKVNKHNRVILKVGRQSGKALDIETDILTTTGFKKLKDIVVGDTIFGKDGNPTNVTFITEVMNNHDCYKVTFDTGYEIIADAEHLWEISSSKLQRGKNKNRVLTTEEIKAKLYDGMTSGRPYIEINSSLNFDGGIGFDPYTFGLWLGDGHSSCGRITCHRDDFEFYKTFIPYVSYFVDSRNEKVITFTVDGLHSFLNTNNILNNKHIPEKFILSSHETRLNILRGLMDSDGSASKNCEFYNKNKRLIDDVCLLLSSLGIKHRTRYKIIDGSKYYTITFRGNGQNFLLERKKRNLSDEICHPKNGRLYFKTIEKVDSVPVRCLTVDNEDHLFLAGRELIPTHNTTTTAAYIAWYIIFNKSKHAAVLANKEKTAIEILSRIKRIFENLPLWLQVGVHEWNKGSVAFDHERKITAASTSSSAIRGLTVNLLVLDEFAFIPKNTYDDFFNSVYATTASDPDAKVIMTSTPYGMNHFYRFWEEAVKGRNGYAYVDVLWNEVPRGMEPEAFKEKTIAEIGETRWFQEFEAQFLGAANSLVPPSVVENMVFDEPLRTEFDGALRVYEEPKEKIIQTPLGEKILKNKYIVIVDISEGVGLDDSAFQVIDVTELPYRQVACFNNNEISPHIFHIVINKMAKHYHDALTIVENNNKSGDLIIENIVEEGNENVFHDKDWGFKVTKLTKKRGCGDLKNMFELDKLRIRDFHTISQLSNFVATTKGSFAAKDGENDDLVMPLVNFAYFMSKKEYVEYWLDIEDNVKSLHNRKIAELEESMTSFGVILDEGEDELISTYDDFNYIDENVFY